MTLSLRTLFWHFVMRRMFKGKHSSIRAHREQGAGYAKWVARVPHRSKVERSEVDVALRVWDGMWHVWHSMGGLIPESGMAFEEMAEFLREREANKDGKALVVEFRRSIGE